MASKQNDKAKASDDGAPSAADVRRRLYGEPARPSRQPTARTKPSTPLPSAVAASLGEAGYVEVPDPPAPYVFDR